MTTQREKELMDEIARLKSAYEAALRVLQDALLERGQARLMLVATAAEAGFELDQRSRVRLAQVLKEAATQGRSQIVMPSGWRLDWVMAPTPAHDVRVGEVS
jgi:hypothetical protein